MPNSNQKPAIRFAGFTEPWEQRKLGKISDKVTEKNAGLQYVETFTNSAEFGVISQKDFFDHSISKMESLDGYYIVRSEDFVYNPRISVTAPVGPINRNKLGRNGVMSPLYTVFRPHEIDNTYLEHFFKGRYWHAYMNFNGDSGARSDRFSIKDDLFFQMPIPLPDIGEQKKIGEYLTELDNLITLHQRKYDKLTVFKKSMLEKMFPKNGELEPEIRFEGFTEPWEQRKLGEVAETYSGGTPSVSNSAYYEGNIPFIRSAEIGASKTELFLSEQGFSDSSARMVNAGNVLYALYGATSGEVAISNINGAINQAILAILPREDISNNYVASWLRREKQNIIGTYLQGGQGNLSGAIVKDLSIPLPCSKEQSKIGALFAQLDKLITLHQRELEMLKKIKQSCLEKMFV